MNTPPMTALNPPLRLAIAAAPYLCAGRRAGSVVIGRDTRRSGEMIEQAALIRRV